MSQLVVGHCSCETCGLAEIVGCWSFSRQVPAKLCAWMMQQWMHVGLTDPRPLLLQTHMMLHMSAVSRGGTSIYDYGSWKCCWFARFCMIGSRRRKTKIHMAAILAAIPCRRLRRAFKFSCRAQGQALNMLETTSNEGLSIPNQVTAMHRDAPF